MRRGLGGAFAALVAVELSSQSARADMDRGAQIAATCAACHRLDGHQAGVPSIIGQPADQISARMKLFKTGVGPYHIMNAVGRSLSDEEIEIVARYLSTMGKDAVQR